MANREDWKYLMIKSDKYDVFIHYAIKRENLPNIRNVVGPEMAKI